jgi:hypothetical protein
VRLGDIAKHEKAVGGSDGFSVFLKVSGRLMELFVGLRGGALYGIGLAAFPGGGEGLKLGAGFFCDE